MPLVVKYVVTLSVLRAHSPAAGLGVPQSLEEFASNGQPLSHKHERTLAPNCTIVQTLKSISMNKHVSPQSWTAPNDRLRKGRRGDHDHMAPKVAMIGPRLKLLCTGHGQISLSFHALQAKPDRAWSARKGPWEHKTIVTSKSAPPTRRAQRTSISTANTKDWCKPLPIICPGSA